MIEVKDLSIIDDALNAARISLDIKNPYITVFYPDTEIIQAYLSFESVRYLFSNRYANFKARGNGQFTLANEMVSELNFGLNKILGDATFRKVAKSFRLARRIRTQNFLYDKGLSELRVNRTSVEDLILIIIGLISDGIYLEEKNNNFEQADLFESNRKLSKILPDQKVSPLRFIITNNRLDIEKSISKPLSNSSEVALSARNELLSKGDRLLSNLRGSNCDPRLISSFYELQEVLRESKNIIQLGLANIELNTIGKRFESELPNALSAMLQAHTVGISMYAAQFSDWVTFTSNAAEIHVNDNDINQMSDILENIIEQTKDNTAIATPEVPRTLERLKVFINDPAHTSGRAALAVARSLENLIIKIFQIGSEYIKKTSDKLVDDLSTATSKNITRALLLVALTSAYSLAPIATKFEGMAWIKDAIQIVEKQVSAFK